MTPQKPFTGHMSPTYRRVVSYGPESEAYVPRDDIVVFVDHATIETHGSRLFEELYKYKRVD